MSNKNILILPIKKKWFDMILSGEKKEEYREIKPYWMNRFKKIFDMYPYSFIPTGIDTQTIEFRNGYGNNVPSFQAKCTLDIKKGKKEWGAIPNEDYYVLKIHEIYNLKNYKGDVYESFIEH